jgi:uncharacterized membrane protein YagU involved in acid resistance
MHPIVLGGLAAGTLDILAAITIWYVRGAAPTRVLQGVAAGLLGRASFDGGSGTAALGLFLHFTIAFIITAIYYAVSRRMSFLIDHPIWSGLIYGAIVFVVMTWIVVPLSNSPPRRAMDAAFIVSMIGAHLFCVGLPIALAVSRTVTTPAVLSTAK